MTLNYHPSSWLRFYKDIKVLSQSFEKSGVRSFRTSLMFLIFYTLCNNSWLFSTCEGADLSNFISDRN
jgi:hypothetical protein